MIWNNVSIKIRTSVILNGIDVQIHKGDVLGIIGPNGRGKTILAKALAGEIPVSGDVLTDDVIARKKYVPFHSSLSLSNGHAVYRQQRWNKIDTELLPKVNELLSNCENSELAFSLANKFGLDGLVNSFVINLSNGEQRKLELVQALASNPDMLVLDNAFTGLDSKARPYLEDMLESLILQGQTLVMTGLSPDDFPPSMKRFLVLGNQNNLKILIREELQIQDSKLKIEPETIPLWMDSSFEELIRLEDVSLNYGEKVILENINWQVNAGERWSLSGPNGSGKTSLLNLIFADNPKAYGCNIRLFGKQKGSGESIWDIKALIGFVSPEHHQYMSQNQSVIDVICSGFNETEGNFKRPTGYQTDLALRWLKALNYSDIGRKNFGELSTSAQRIVLFIRTLVKNPPLLILDEPFQGLDAAHVRMLKDLLNHIAASTNCAMIFVTHIPSELPECFNRHLKLKDGKIAG